MRSGDAGGRANGEDSAVLEKPEGAETGAGLTGYQPPPRRDTTQGAEAFGGAQKVDIAHQNLKHGDRCGV